MVPGSGERTPEVVEANVVKQELWINERRPELRSFASAILRAAHAPSSRFFIAPSALCDPRQTWPSLWSLKLQMCHYVFTGHLIAIIQVTEVKVYIF